MASVIITADNELTFFLYPLSLRSYNQGVSLVESRLGLQNTEVIAGTPLDFSN
jgi:hypothetical protein